jgi:GT2 family glycosyltransferase
MRERRTTSCGRWQSSERESAREDTTLTATVTLGAVVVHYRRWPDVRQCIDALLAQTRRPDETIIVDNRSDDGSPDRIRAAYPVLAVVEASENAGYGAGVNLGVDRLRTSRHDAVLVLTHECVLAPDALERMAARLRQDARLGAVGPLLGYRSDPNRVFSAGGTLETRTWRGRHVHKPIAMRDWDGAEPRQVDWLDGACLLIRAAAIEDVGPMDDRFFMYFEELDYCTRMRRAGWRLECVPAGHAWQEPGEKPTYLWTRNRLRFLARQAPRRQVVREVLRLIRRIGRRLGTNPDGSSLKRVELTALLHFLLARSGPPPERFRPVGSITKSPVIDGN